jgi:hypothetical protein
MKIFKSLVLIFVLLLGACAQVPKESVELSATVGRDMVEMKKAHVALVQIYYDELINDINKFIDNVYLPYQIQKTLADNIWKSEMMSAIESASQPDSTGKKQKEAFQKIEAFLQIIHEEVESYRKLKIDPAKDQKQEVLDSIQDAYDRIHYANSIVTGHLASVVKVHDTQNEILEKFELKDIREKVGIEIAGVSNEIGGLIQKAKDGESKLDEVVTKFDELLKEKEE